MDARFLVNVAHMNLHCFGRAVQLAGNGRLRAALRQEIQHFAFARGEAPLACKFVATRIQGVDACVAVLARFAVLADHCAILFGFGKSRIACVSGDA